MPIDRIQLWYETHYNKKTKKWIDANSEEIYNKLEEAKQNAEAECGTPMTVDEIFDKVVPPRSGYLQGSGLGPKRKTKAHAAKEAKCKEAEDRAMSAEKLNEQLLQQVADLKSRQDKLEESFMHKLVDEITRRFQQSGFVSGNGAVPSWMDDVGGGREER